MNWDRVEGNWKQFKGEIRETWGRFTEDDVEIIEGRRDQLVGKLQEKYGILREEAERQIEEFLNYLDYLHREETHKGGRK